MTNFQVSKLPIVLLLFLILWFSSCRTAREIPMADAKPISTGKLLKKVEQNAFDYNYLAIKRISCQFVNNKKSTNFKVSLKAQKDKKILVAISKVNIPVGRVLLTPDSVKYVNYIERNYFVDDYSYLSKFLNIDLDFATIQSILSNNAFSYRNDAKNRDFKTFDSFIEAGMYVLQSEKSKKMFKLEEKQKTGKIERRMKRLDDDALILQKMYFNPSNFALTRLVVDDKTNKRVMNMIFEDFVRVQNKDYPGKIDMSFNSAQSKVSLKMKMSGFSTDKINSIGLNIPKKYEQLRMN